MRFHTDDGHTTAPFPRPAEPGWLAVRAVLAHLSPTTRVVRFPGFQPATTSQLAGSTQAAFPDLQMPCSSGQRGCRIELCLQRRFVPGSKGSCHAPERVDPSSARVVGFGGDRKSGNRMRRLAIGASQHGAYSRHIPKDVKHLFVQCNILRLLIKQWLMKTLLCSGTTFRDAAHQHGAEGANAVGARISVPKK